MIEYLGTNERYMAKGKFTDKNGNYAIVEGTYAFGAPLSWYLPNGTYVAINGFEQNVIIPEPYRIKANERTV